jgi:hypothetical protein
VTNPFSHFPSIFHLKDLKNVEKPPFHACLKFIATTKGQADRSLLDTEGYGDGGGNVDFTLDFWSEHLERDIAQLVVV